MKFLSANKFTISAFFLCIFSSVIVFIISFQQTKKARATSEEVVRTNSVLNNIDKVVTKTLDLQSSIRGYLITGDEEFLLPINNIDSVYNQSLQIIRQQGHTDSDYLKKLDSLSNIIPVRLAISENVIKLKKEGNTNEAKNIIASRNGNTLTESIKRLCEWLKNEELIKQNQTRIKNENAIVNLNRILNIAWIIVIALGTLLLVRVRKNFFEYRNGEEKFRALLESAPDAMLITDKNNHIQLANIEAEKMFAYSKNELLGTPINVLIKEGISDAYTNLKNGARQRQNKINPDKSIEITAVTKNGDLIPAEVTLSPISINNETFIAVAIRDISQRKATAQEIKNLFAQINQANEAIYVLDTNFIITSWNKGAEAIYGYTKEEATGVESVELLKPNKTMEEIEMADEQVKKTGGWTGELERITKAGNKVLVYSSLTAVKDNKGIINSFISVSFDITYRKKLETQVNYLASIVEQSTEAVISVNNDRRIISWNNGAEKLHGYTTDEALGKTMLELGIARYTEEDLQESLNALITNGKWVKEDRLYHKSGNFFWGLITANLIKDGFGEVHSVVFFEKDISIQKRLQNELAHNNEMLEQKVKERTEEIIFNERKYKLLYDSNPMPMWVYDIETLHLLDVNEALEVLYGYTRAELLAMTLLDVRDDAEKEKFLKVDHSYKKEEGLSRGIWKHRKKNGSEINVEIFNHPVLYEGKKARITMLIDVTDRLKVQAELAASEKRFRALIENSYDIITMLDKDFKVLYRSPSAIRVTGRTNDEVLGLDGRERIHPDDIKIVAEGIRRLLAEPGRTEECIFRYLHKDGTYLWMEGNATNLLHDENIKAIVYNYRDVTERIKNQEALKKEQDKLKRISAVSPGLIYSFRMTPEGVFSFPFVSSAYHEIFGIPAEVLKYNVNKVIEESIKDDAILVVNSIIESATNMTPWNLEFRYMHPVKGLTWLQGNSIPARETDGSTIWYGTIMDITEKVKTARALEEEKNKLVKIAETSPGLLYSFKMSTDGSFSFPFVSTSVDDICGLSIETVLTNGAAVFEKVDDEDREFVINSILESAKNLSHWKCTFKYNHPEKGKVWLQANSLPLVDADGSILWHGIVLDMTEQKKTEEAVRNSYIEKQMLAERLTTILNTLPANIALLDEHGVIIDVNQAWRSFADFNGWYGKNYGIGENYIHISEHLLNFINIDGQKVADGITAVLVKQIHEFVYEYECSSPDEKRWFRMIVSPLSGTVYSGAVVMHIDISEIKKLEEEKLRHKVEEQKLVTTAILQGQEKERSIIGKELHDNINQILAGINMLLELIRKKPERIKELLPLCIENVNQAVSENRKIAHNLASPEEYSEKLIELVKRVAKNMLTNAGVNTKIEYNNFDEDLLTREQKLATYRIIQEHCNNIQKHAAAQNVILLIQTLNNSLLLIIKDDGQGADLTQQTNGIGLENIKNRVHVFNGQSNIITKPGAGFMLTVEMPLMTFIEEDAE
jgi:PAS domain S-box-containing protein